MRATTLTWAGRAASGAGRTLSAVRRGDQSSAAVILPSRRRPSSATRQALSFRLASSSSVCMALYAIPRTSVLGAILLTGHLGGAVAHPSPSRQSPAGFTLFPLYVAALLWAGIYLATSACARWCPLTSRSLSIPARRRSTCK